MTVRSWHRTEVDNTLTNFGGDKIVHTDDYNQNGQNTSRALRELGQWSENPYVMTSTVVDNPGIRYEHKDFPEALKGKEKASFFGATPYFEPIAFPDTGLAVARLLSNWRNSDFELGVTIGEGRESAQMIVERLSSIGRAVRAVRQGNIRGAIGALGGGGGGGGSTKRAQLAAAAGNFSSAFLELELGWKPLIRDIYALADHVKVKPRRNIVRTSAKTKGYVSPQPTGSFPAGGIYGRNIKRIHLKVEVSQAPTEIERLGLTDPLSIAWNLTGLSFIADWFLPIGDTLAMWHTLMALPVMRCCHTEVTEKVGFGRVNGGQVYGSYRPVTSGQYATDHVRVDRYVSNSPLALWGVLGRSNSNIPTWDPTLRQMGILSALVHQRILRL